jgi:hypothetical protein
MSKYNVTIDLQQESAALCPSWGALDLVLAIQTLPYVADLPLRWLPGCTRPDRSPRHQLDHHNDCFFDEEAGDLALSCPQL